MTVKSIKKYTDYIVDEVVKLLAIDSPTGYTDEAAAFVMAEFKKLGYEPKLTNKGGVLVCLGGKDQNNGLLLEAHTDTLGGMVATIKEDGRLKITPLGGMNANNAETENVRIITKFDGAYEGTCQLCNASIHVNGEYNDTKRTFDSVEIVIDEAVSCSTMYSIPNASVIRPVSAASGRPKASSGFDAMLSANSVAS